MQYNVSNKLIIINYQLRDSVILYFCKSLTFKNFWNDLNNYVVSAFNRDTCFITCSSTV